ncbi:poly polymerase catalytic domain-domain-containing protein [Syncephalastrum racemosum]|uniref:Poly [ADP-ribose] polymerase n=1 Tax=Syncephalastrum racemosum TaxID=13706 RepID=A0A1X2HVS3_SYNRA|nr:poly polymerase catalytic domain-domain-containing protein [Syncephalastrum racemosum]
MFAIDADGRSPMHYAAKHGQSTLLRYLCARHAPNMTDNAGLSELWYAAASGHAECAKILLEAGAQVNLSSKDHDSVLLAATKTNNAVLVQHLLHAGAALDDDTAYDRANAVMWCCQHGFADTLSLLVKGGACLSTPSRIPYKHDDIETDVVLPPLLVADGDLFPLLVRGGADLNVYGPEIKPFNSESAFLYFSRQKNTDRLKLMLDHAVDVNQCEKTSGRSIFYSYLFDEKFKRDLPFIWERLLRMPSVQVTQPDPVTQMTPLEYFIRKHDAVVVDRLLELGADPTILSAATDRVSLYASQGPVNAFFHAVAQNDLAILQKLCEHTPAVDWHMTDEGGATIISFAVRSAQGYSYQNTEMLKYLQKAMGDVYLTVFEKPDNQGLRPADYACRQRHDLLYQALLELGVAPADADQDMEDAMEQDNNFIPSQEVEAAAEAERAALELQEKEKAKSDDEKKDEDAQDKIDSYSGMQTYGRLVHDETHPDRPLDIMLQKIDINSYNSFNMFYKMSVIYNTVLDVYVLWTRWGSFGEEGMHQKTPYLTLPEAVAEFRSIFRSKSGNTWDDYLEGNFEAKPGRFELIRARPPRKLPVLHPLDLADALAVAPSQLPRPIHETMQVVADFDLLVDTYKQLGLDVPVGQVPQSSIDEAYLIMKRIQATQTKLEEMRSNLDTAEKHAKRRELVHKLCQDSTAYYRLLPRANDKKRGISALHNKSTIDEEMGRLNNVSYVNFAAQVVLAARHHAREINPLDYSYRALQCGFEYMPKETVDFTMVSEYLRTTAKQRAHWQVEHLFKVDRFEERERFSPYANTANRMLLWHGSHVANFMGILKQGLRPKPAAAGHNGSLYGNGIYFADMFCKSISYAGQKEQHKGYALLALCEVALGNECEMTYHNRLQFEEGDYQSVKGLGEEGPNPANIIYDDSGVKIPMGPSIKYDYSRREVYTRPLVNMNEYVVYDESRVRIRYLVLVRDTSLCSLCQQKAQDLRALGNIKIERDYIRLPKNEFGLYDALTVRAYAVSKGTDCKELVEQHLDDWLETRKYSK